MKAFFPTVAAISSAQKLLRLCLVLFLLAACTQQPAADRSNRNQERMKQFYDQLVNAHNAAMTDSFFHADVKDHVGTDETVVGSAELKKGFETFFAAFPDAHLEQHAYLGSGDTLAVQLTMTGTNTGPLRGLPPTNKAIHIDGIAVFAWKDGKITERWRYFDDMLMMQQLGLAPQPPKGE